LLGTHAPIVDWVGRSVVDTSGRGTYSQRLKELFPSVWGQYIIPHPAVSPSEIAIRQANALFVVVPSDWDVLNLTCVEAMARGAIVICSEGAGASDLIIHGQNGFTFSAGDHVKLAELIKYVQTLSEVDRSEIAANAQSTVRHTLHPDIIGPLVLHELHQAKSLVNRIPDPPDILALYLMPSLLSSGPKVNMFRGLDRIALAKLFYYLFFRLWSKLLSR
jgi:hypothetical protein